MKSKNKYSGENSIPNKTEENNTKKASKSHANEGTAERKMSVKLVSLKALLSTLDSPSHPWPTEALKSTLKRFEQMPGGG